MEGKLPDTYTNFKDFCLEKPFVALFAAPRKAGKTVMMNNLLRECWKHDFDNIVVVSPTLAFKDEYVKAEEMPERVRYIKVKENLAATVDQVIREQKILAQQHLHQPEKFPEVHTLLILDDCIDHNLFQYNSSENVVDEIAHVGRHFNLSVALTSQSLSKISVETRKNAEALFVFAPNNYMDFERVLEEYVPRDFKKDLRIRIREVWKNQYAFLLIDNSPERRTHFKKIIRNGFSELLYDLEEEDREAVPDRLLTGEKQSHDQEKSHDVIHPVQ